jgi:uncharacterized protein YdiU (UPF0061 family)
MDQYDPEWTPNKQDTLKRYRFENQPAMTQWALARLGESLISLIGESWASNSRPKTADDTVDLSKNSHSIPHSRRMPLGFLFNSEKSENILREILSEFEIKFNTRYGEIMCQKLGIPNYDPKDYDTLINPLLELLASAAADYTLFFRALCSLSLSEPLYSEASRYDPSGLHRLDILRNSTPKDCLGILLKGLVRQIDSDLDYVTKENDLRSKSHLFNTHTEKLEPLPFPSLEDISNTWKLWLPLYRSRLLAHLPPAQRNNAEIVKTEDRKRQEEMKQFNPQYALRGHILEHIMQTANNHFVPEFEMKHAPGPNEDRSEPSETQIQGVTELERFYQVLVVEAFNEQNNSSTNEDLKEKFSKYPDIVNFIDLDPF